MDLGEVGGEDLDTVVEPQLEEGLHALDMAWTLMFVLPEETTTFWCKVGFLDFKKIVEIVEL